MAVHSFLAAGPQGNRPPVFHALVDVGDLGVLGRAVAGQVAHECNALKLNMYHTINTVLEYVIHTVCAIRYQQLPDIAYKINCEQSQ